MRKVETAKRENRQSLGSNGQTFEENTCTYFWANRILGIILVCGNQAVVLSKVVDNRQSVDLDSRKAEACGRVTDVDLGKNLAGTGFDNDVFCMGCKNLIGSACDQNNLDSFYPAQNLFRQSHTVPMAQNQSYFVDKMP